MILFAECNMENVRSLKDLKGLFFFPTICLLKDGSCRLQGLKNGKLKCPVVFHYLGQQIPTSGMCLSQTQDWSPFSKHLPNFKVEWHVVNQRAKLKTSERNIKFLTSILSQQFEITRLLSKTWKGKALRYREEPETLWVYSLVLIQALPERGKQKP